MAGVSERGAEYRSLREHFHKDFPNVRGKPPVGFPDAIRSWEAAKKRRDSDWIVREQNRSDIPKSPAERRAWWAELDQRYADLRSERYVGTFTEHHLARLHDLEKIAQKERDLREGAAIELRDALAEGHLAAFLRGVASPIDRSRWHKGDALKCVLDARLLGQADVRAVVIKAVDFAAWLHSGQEATGAPGNVVDQIDVNTGPKKRAEGWPP